MSNAFTNFLSGVLNGSGNLRDYQHASRLYRNNNYALTPKAGWIYYVAININADVVKTITDPAIVHQFNDWYTKNKGVIGLMAKQVDMPRFTIDTEVLNQYNKKTIIQKKINYGGIGITFHDDMANVTTNLWKSYYQYYYGDSVDAGKTGVSSNIIPKYIDNKYKDFNEQQDYRYGLNNGQDIPFFTSIDIYQLNQKKFTSFKLVNPIIKEWAHDQLDQTQGNRLLGSKMQVEYETVIYNTSPNNAVTKENPGFNKDHYDTTPSPLSIGGQGTVSIFGPGGLVAGASSIFGSLTNPGGSPLDLLNTAIQGGNLIRNAGNVSGSGIREEGLGIFNSVLSGVSSKGQGTITSGALNGLNQAISPAGINVPNGTKPPDQISATPVNISGR
jgi:hypothetical protein